ncbi:MAG: T9SS type A sorting domain-containing protein [Candidatus Cloacimonetes bacterium]|nr:T9SS type A sorting domain-containing protein [Candidatus Cloacimonadota bacterium]
MKKIIIFSVLILFSFSTLHAVIGWSGNIWPNSGSNQTNGSDITVYYQIWKDGVTGGSGPGADLSATLFYKKSTETTYQSYVMTYNTAVGNNDEYMGTIPDTYFGSGDIINFYCEGYDSTDATYSYGTDQAGGGPYDAGNPGSYNIVGGISQDVTVTFQVDLSVVGPIEPVTVAGSFNGWNASANELTAQGNDIYAGDVLFTAGTNPSQEYKFVNGGNWENEIANRTLTIDDSSPTMILPVVYFNNLDPNDFTDIDVTVTVSVDVADSVGAGCVFDSLGIYGNVAPFDWDFGVIHNELVEIITDELWTGEFLFPAGSWKHIEFKLGRNGLDLEAGFGENHTFDIDDSSPTQLISCVYGTMGPVTSIDDPQNQGNIFMKCSPNPFNTQTHISFALKSQTYQEATVSIFNLKGQLVQKFETQTDAFGQGDVTWDGKDLQGKELKSGIYFYKISTNDVSEINKMIMMR